MQREYHGGELLPDEYDKDHYGMMLADFVAHKHSKGCKLSEANVLAVRLYTTSCYQKLSTPLRFKCTDPSFDHPLKMTVYYLAEGLSALRTIAAKDEEKYSRKKLLYRGMKGREMDTEKLKAKGGIERALMSTSDKRDTAYAYSEAFCPKVCKRGEKLETEQVGQRD